jgi:peptidoglycan/LPS O-acetylase OafA/YrhL
VGESRRAGKTEALAEDGSASPGSATFVLSGEGGPWEVPGELAAQRNTQLDGWRAFAVAGVMWHHWVPSAWRWPFPFEIGLFFFLTFSGFLITRILLNERANGEANAAPWRAKAFKDYAKRRLTRILAPCYAAMVFALVVGAPDIRAHALSYFGHVSNFHMAWMPDWPSGTAHYWTLALQMQFYFFWPLVVFFALRRSLPWVFAACVVLAPVSRMVIDLGFPQIYHSEAISLTALDYLGVGALLAFALRRGMKPGNVRLTLAACLAFAGYVTLYVCNLLGHACGGLGYIQQTLLAIAFAGLISRTLAGIGGIPGRTLDHPAVQHIGRLSYGLYLFHAPVPRLLGKILPFLWFPVFNSGPLLALRLAVFALASWGAAWLCWRWLEGPNRLRFPRLAALFGG